MTNMRNPVGASGHRWPCPFFYTGNAGATDLVCVCELNHQTGLDPKYVPTTADVKAAYMKSRAVYANVPEKLEYELGFDLWLAKMLDIAKQ